MRASLSTMHYLPICKGLATRLPGIMKLRGIGSTRSSDSACYCYGVWLKHLTIVWDSGMQTLPRQVAELGPGDSLGTTLAALLSGAEKGIALDIVRYADVQRNLLVFDELVDLFQARSARPTKGWPDFDELLDERLFPSHILTESVLEQSLQPERIAAIRRELAGESEPHFIEYRVPWTQLSVIEAESIDLINTHSFMEHVHDLPGTYRACAQWLRPGGWLSAQIDFYAHLITPEWNGHLAYPEWVWKIVVGKRPYLLNRAPWSEHKQLLQDNKLSIIKDLGLIWDNGLRREQLAPQFRTLSDNDLNCKAAFIAARKPVR